MTYKLVFRAPALKEWTKLPENIKTLFKKQLERRLTNPHVPSAKLSSMPDAYKIKLRSAGYRLVYQVRDSELLVSVVAVGKRERNEVYNKAKDRL